MSDVKEFYLGVDIGGTQTRFALAERNGTVRRVLTDAGANYEVCGIETLEKILSNGIQRIIRETGIQAEDIKFVYYGAAGADTETDFKLLRKVFQQVTPGPAFDFENDGLIALKSATVDGVGMVVTCGTGNINFAVNSHGVAKRMGGLGYFSGDVLGAHHIAGDTFHAALRSKDGRGYPSILQRLLPEALGVKQVEEVTDLERSPENVKKTLETLFGAAGMGDGKALAITWKLVREILDIVDVFYNALFRDDTHFKLVLAGSVFKRKYPPLMTMLTHAMDQKYAAEIVIPEHDPVVGALFYALEAGGVDLTTDLTETIISTYMKNRVTQRAVTRKSVSSGGAAPTRLNWLTA
ncbi:MAG: hypothetical protein JRH15_22940 [Deltaproteobacteria bacterium]|nr:hypothetical protein [Deltaproteobacteria bacterium]